MKPLPTDLALAGLVSQLAEREPRFGYSDPDDLRLSYEDALIVAQAEPSVLADALTNADTASYAIDVLARPVTAAADTLLGVVIRNALQRQAATYLLPSVKARISELDEEREQAFERRKYGRPLSASERAGVM